VEGLAEGDARALLESLLTGPLDARVRDRIIADTHGNPLALLELPRGLTPAQLTGGFGFSGAVPLDGRIEESFGRQLEALPAQTRKLVQLAAADPSGDPVLVWRAAGRLAIGAGAAGPAAEAGLAEFGARVRFRHPLVRSAAYRSASVQTRQELHGALAEVTDPAADPDRRAWHRAEAAPGALRAFRGQDTSAEEGLSWLWLAEMAAIAVWDDETWHILASRHVKLAREAGALSELPLAVLSRYLLHAHAGELEQGAGLIAEAQAVADATGSRLGPYGGLGVAAFRGREAEATELIQATMDGVTSRGEGRQSASSPPRRRISPGSPSTAAPTWRSGLSYSSAPGPSNGISARCTPSSESAHAESCGGPSPASGRQSHRPSDRRPRHRPTTLARSADSSLDAPRLALRAPLRQPGTPSRLRQRPD
jgi:hypothetical protein